MVVGVLTTCDSHALSLTNVDRRRYTLTVSLTSNTSAKSFTLTNVYALADHVDTPFFVSSLILSNEFRTLGLC